METIKKIQIDMYHKDDTTNTAIVHSEEKEDGKVKLYACKIKEMKLDETYRGTVAFSQYAYLLAKLVNDYIEEGYIIGHIF